LTGSLEILVAQPLRRAELALGLVGFPFVFGFLRAVLYLIIAIVVFGLDISPINSLGLLIVLPTAAAALSVVGMVAAAVVLVVKRGELAVGMALLLMTLVSGAYFPVDVLPPWLEWTAAVVPLRYALDGARGALFGEDLWIDDVGVLLSFAAVGIPVGLWTFGRALDVARRHGTLAQY
jgi:ABC-2 type transport system permease protein